MKARNLSVLLLSALLLGACGGKPTTGARASLVAAEDTSTVLGTATFSDTDNGLLMDLEVNANSVISPGLHAVHIHENGACGSADSDGDGVVEAAGAAGGHYNPTNVGHGEDNGPHAGDSEAYNYVFGADGSATLQVRFPAASLEGANPVLRMGGTAVIIHQGVDDKASDPGGNSGSRIACGVLERTQ